MDSNVSETFCPSVFYISSDSEDSVEDCWDSDWSDGEVENLAVQVDSRLSTPMLIAGRCGVSDEVHQILPKNAPCIFYTCQLGYSNPL